MPFDQIPLGEGLHPDGTKGAEFFVDKELIDHVKDQGISWKDADANFLYEAVGDPDAIFYGLKREGKYDALCYSVRPSHDPENPGAELPPSFGKVFLAFVELRQGYVIFDFDWRDEDFETPGHPKDWENDFQERTWWKT